MIENMMNKKKALEAAEMTITEFIAKKVAAGKISPTTALEMNRLIYKEFIARGRKK